MFSVTVSEKGGPQRRLDFDKTEVSIGRIQGNDVMLPKGNVSKRHARIVIKDEKYIIVDLKSTNGTYVNGRKIQSPQVVKKSDKVYIGDFILALEYDHSDSSSLDGGASADLGPADPPPTPPGMPATPPPPQAGVRPLPMGRGGPPAPLGGEPEPPFGGPRLGGPEGSPFGDGPSFGEGSPFGDAPAGFGDASLSFDDEPGRPEPALVPESAAPEPPRYEPPRYEPPRPEPPHPEPPRAESPRPEPPRAEPPRYEPPRYEPPRADPPRAEPPRPEPAQEADSEPAAPAPLAARSPAPPRVVAARPAADPQPSTLREGLAPLPELPTFPMPPARHSAVRPSPLAQDEAEEDELLRRRQAVLRRLMDRLVPQLAALDVGSLSWEAFREQAENLVYEQAERLASETPLPEGLDRDQLVQDALNEATGYGPLEDLLLDESVREILVNDPRHIYVNRGVELEREPRFFSSDTAVLSVLQRLVQETGVRVGPNNPAVDVRRKDGLRVTGLIPPVATRGAVITLRRSSIEPLDMDDLILNETLSAEMAEFLEACVRARKNILVVGGARAGKTSLLNSLTAAIPSDERVLTIEESSELLLPLDNVVSLESRPAIHGQAGLAAGELINIGLRMRPDRILVGDLTGDGALELLRAMNSGSEGVLTCVHAGDAQAALDRLEAMSLMGGRELPVRTVRELIANGVDLMVILSRYTSGERKVTSILAVAGLDVDLVNLEEVFFFEPTGSERGGSVQGRFRPTGFVPRFFEDMQRRGLAPARNLFR